MFKERTIIFGTVLLYLCLLIAFPGSLNAQESRHVLFIGNSYTQVNNLPLLVASIAQDMGDELTYGSNTPGGCTFQQHCTNQSMTMIQQGGWDAVVLQEQSQYPSFPQSQVENEVFPFAQQLVDAVYDYNPCAEPVFYMTWGRKNGDQGNAPYFPVLGTYEGMDSMLYERYCYMASANDASLCPVGRVWRYLRQRCPEIELYQTDESHPSLAGSYAAACAFYVMFFHRDPRRISYTAGLEESVALSIRNAVAEVVFDTLSHWQRPWPQAGFVSDTASAEPPYTVVFYNGSVDSDSVVWDFGDGETATFTVASDSFMQCSHTYTDTGMFTVTLRALRHCMDDTASMPIHITQTVTPPDTVAISESSFVETVALLPNPTVGDAWLTLPDGITDCEVELYTSSGCRLWSQTVTESVAIPIKEMPEGCYILRISSKLGVAVKKIVKM